MRLSARREKAGFRSRGDPRWAESYGSSGQPHTLSLVSVSDTPPPRGCAFCRGRPLTREHVWPAWIHRLVAEAPAMPHRRRTEFESRTLEEREFMLRPFTMTVKAVCGVCNSGWMSRVEEAAKPLLMPGLHGRGKRLSPAGQQALATWAFKSALVFGLTRRWPRGIPDEHYKHLLAHGRPPEQSLIWMGAYNGPEPAFVQLAGMAISRPGERVNSESRPNVYIFTFTLASIFLQVFASADAEAFDVTTAHYRDPRLRTIWPTGETFDWTPNGGLGTGELQRYADAIHDGLNRRYPTATTLR
jgi:hypothetical protein